jgi:hypothetical protein
MYYCDNGETEKELCVCDSLERYRLSVSVF